MTINVYHKLMGGHVHVRVFVNGANAGSLILRDSEWPAFRDRLVGRVNFYDDDKPGWAGPDPDF